MKILCISNEGYQFSKNMAIKGNEKKIMYDGVQKNKIYLVYGIILHEGSIKYLLFDEHKMPNWYPAELFSLIDTKIPNDWNYQFFGYKDAGVSAIWGYYELVFDDNHFDGLSEQDHNEYELFLKRKQEIDKQVNED